MQSHKFTTGGYVAHKLTGSFKGTCSAWYSADGKLIDAEQYPRGCGGPNRPVKVGGPVWCFLASRYPAVVRAAS